MARTLSILVLDDNANNADALADLLSMEDHKVKVVYSG
jgi:CheY-like chemotaxis protein